MDLDTMWGHARRFERQVSSLLELLSQRYGPEVQRVAAAARGLGDTATAAEKTVEELEERARLLLYPPPRPPRTPTEAMELVPGPRNPMTYTVVITYPTANDTMTRTGAVRISPDGPFIITSVDAMYRVQDSLDPLGLRGRYTATSGFRWFAKQGGSVALATAAGPDRLGAYQPEFDFQVQTGDGRRWCSDTFCGFIFDPNERTNAQLPVGWVDPTDRIVVTSVPKNPSGVPIPGQVEVNFRGFEIVNPVRLADLIAL